MRIALTGGIACGKSLVAKFLNEFGVETIDADDIVHDLIPDPAERKRIAAEVFGNETKRKELEARLHPLVKAEINRRIVRIVESSNPRIADVKLHSRLIPSSETPHPDSTIRTIRRFDDSDSSTISPIAIIPLLFEAHWEKNFDIICCVRSARATQVARMMETRGYTREEAEARLAAQMPVEEKAAKSHYVIDNNGSVQELELQVAEFVNWLREREIVEESESSNRANYRIV